METGAPLPGPSADFERVRQDYTQSLRAPPGADHRSHWADGESCGLAVSLLQHNVEAPFVVVEERVDKERLRRHVGTASAISHVAKLLELGGHDEDGRAFSFVVSPGVGAPFARLFLLLSLRDENLPRVQKIIARIGAVLVQHDTERQWLLVQGFTPPGPRQNIH